MDDRRDGQCLTWGRETCGDLAAAERREWICANGIGGFASGTIAGTLTRRYHGLLIATLQPPLGRTLLATQIHDAVDYAGSTWALFASRWDGDVVDPHGYRYIEAFRLDGTTPVWTYACADALVERRVWMEPGANTTYVRYACVRAAGALALTMKVLVNYRDYHSTTRTDNWRMTVAPVQHGVQVVAFDGARPLTVLAAGADAAPAHTWYRGFFLRHEHDRGLDDREDHLHVATFRATLRPGAALSLVLSAEPAPSLDGAAAWERRQRHERDVIAQWRTAQPDAVDAPAWIEQLALAADQFIVRRAFPDDPEGRTVIAGYPWFGTWGRDTMIALPGLALTTGRVDVARKILTTSARFIDRGMLPNHFPDTGEAPEYNTVDATLWFFEALRAYHEVTRDDGTLKALFPVLEAIVARHREGTRYGIHVDHDGLLTAGRPGVQLTWMDARVGDHVVTPRTGKAIEVNALWHSALRTMARFASVLGRSSAPYDALAERAAAGFERFWNPVRACCYDVIDTRGGDDAAMRPNQIFAVSLPDSPLPLERRRAVVDACARQLLTSHGLRTLAPDDPAYHGHYGGDERARASAYHQGTVWAWLLGPFALAHAAVYHDARAARTFLAPFGNHLGDHGLGTIAEIFQGDAPFAPDGCIAQAWSVAETLRAWHDIPRVAAAWTSPTRVS